MPTDPNYDCQDRSGLYYDQHNSRQKTYTIRAYVPEHSREIWEHVTRLRITAEGIVEFTTQTGQEIALVGCAVKITLEEK